ncbi:MAG: AI-2E family transporter [Geminicoccaceae bacterium]|jgi:predicted PurR-regulated permease PerM|nr:AI-2E family transporter [Geminicoccaceae bacterium]
MSGGGQLHRKVSIIVVATGVALLLVFTPQVPLIVFAGVLFAIFLRGGGAWLAALAGVGTGWGMLVFWLVVIAAFGIAGTLFAPLIVAQLDQLARELPPAIDELRRSIEGTAWGDWLLHSAMPEQLAPAEASGALTSATLGTFGALGSFVIVLIIGIYGAVDPQTYRNGFIALLAPSLRPRGEELMDRAAATLGRWLVGRILSMATVGVLTALGLWMIGVPLAAILGFIAALLAFIPNLGPVLSVVPAVLLALPEGMTTVLLVLAIYTGVQAVESYLVTPLIQQRQVSLPAAFILAVQLLMGILFGLLGLILATPLAALLVMLTREVYVRDWLDAEPERAGRG